MFDNLDLEKLRLLTEVQLKTQVKSWIDERTKKQLIILIMLFKTLDIDNLKETILEESMDSINGQIKRVHAVKDAIGSIEKRLKIEWSYYPSSEVDVITETELDALG